MITSTANPRIKQLVKWQSKARERRRDGIFVAEGEKMFAEAPEGLIREVYLETELEEKLKAGSTEKDRMLFNKLRQVGYEAVTLEVMRHAADTQTPQGILTVLTQPSYEIKEVLSDPEGLYLLVEDLQDPGNLGTIFRTAEGAGVNGILLSGGTVDLFNPKTIRSTMGSVYRMPFFYIESMEQAFSLLREKGISTYAAHLQGKSYYNEFSYRKGTAFLIGNEGNGLKQETAQAADYCLKIPMEGKVESLNAAISAAILLYEAHRQRG